MFNHCIVYYFKSMKSMISNNMLGDMTSIFPNIIKVRLKCFHLEALCMALSWLKCSSARQWTLNCFCVQGLFSFREISDRSQLSSVWEPLWRVRASSYSPDFQVWLWSMKIEEGRKGRGGTAGFGIQGQSLKTNKQTNKAALVMEMMRLVVRVGITMLYFCKSAFYY